MGGGRPMKVRDDRLPPFSWGSNEAISRLIHAFGGQELNRALGVYQGLTFMASTRRDGRHDGFEATKTEIAGVCGLSTKRLGEYLGRIEEIGLLESEGGGGSRSTLWRLVTPDPSLLSDAPTDRTQRPIETQRPGQPDAASGRTKRRREEHQERTVEQAVPSDLLPLIATLNRVVEGKGAKPLKRGAALKACRDFADRDLAREADRFAHYWLDGAGENRTLRDVAGGWRNWLRTSPRARTLRAVGNGSAASRADADIARLERMKADVPAEDAA